MASDPNKPGDGLHTPLPPSDAEIAEAYDAALTYQRHLIALAKQWRWEDACLLMKAQPVQRARILAERQFRSSIYKLWDVGVPLRIAEELWQRENFAETPALVAVREFTESDLTFCLLLGGVGCGKTVAACWSLLDRRIYGFRDPVTKQEFDLPGEIDLKAVKFMRASSIARLSIYDDAEQWDALREVMYLVIDDVGVEAGTEFWGERFGELIDVRYGEQLRTVLTSNLSAAAFKAKYGARVASRLNGDGMVVNCGAVDLRARPDQPPDAPADTASPPRSSERKPQP